MPPRTSPRSKRQRSRIFNATLDIKRPPQESGKPGSRCGARGSTLRGSCQSNGVQENLALLDARMWHGRVLDLFIAELKPGEKLLEVYWWKLVTTLRTRTYHELKAACRMVVETNDTQFERSFESDETRRAAEAAEAERANPTAPQCGRNTDFPRGVRP